MARTFVFLAVAGLSAAASLGLLMVGGFGAVLIGLPFLFVFGFFMGRLVA